MHVIYHVTSLKCIMKDGIYRTVARLPVTAEFLPTASAATGTVSQIIASAVMDQNGQDSVIDCQLP